MNYFYVALRNYQQHYNIEVRKIKVLQYLAISPTGILVVSNYMLKEIKKTHILTLSNATLGHAFLASKLRPGLSVL